MPNAKNTKKESEKEITNANDKNEIFNKQKNDEKSHEAKEEKNNVHKKTTECPFLSNEINTEYNNKIEIENEVFDELGVLYVYIDKWQNCGPGKALIIKDNLYRMCFVRDNLGMLGYNFIVSYDIKLNRKGKQVMFLGCEKDANNNVKFVNYAVSFQNEEVALKFVNLLENWNEL